MAMPMADNRFVRAICRRRLRPPPIARPPRKRRLQFFFDQRFDKAPHLPAKRRLDRVEPIVEKPCVGRIGRRLRAIPLHGVISIGAPTPILFVETTRRLRHLQIPTTSATAPERSRAEDHHDCRARAKTAHRVVANGHNRRNPDGHHITGSCLRGFVEDKKDAALAPGRVLAIGR